MGEWVRERICVYVWMMGERERVFVWVNRVCLSLRNTMCSIVMGRVQLEEWSNFVLESMWLSVYMWVSHCERECVCMCAGGHVTVWMGM